MKRITLDEIMRRTGIENYEDLYQEILREIDLGLVKPVLASGTNGKKPALYVAYWQLDQKEEFAELEEELKFQMDPSIHIDYYMKHHDSYRQDRRWVLMLNKYLRNKRELLQTRVSANERSFEIWRREKFLTREQGAKILKRCEISSKFLNTYETTEPLAYYVHTRIVPQNILILENKDTFYSMRRYLLEEHNSILGVDIGTLVYGAGKGILRSFRDFSFCVEPYVNNANNKIYYFGDLDYEGIGIYEKLSELFGEEHEILPFCPAYEAMLRKAQQEGELPVTKEKQNRRLKNIFYHYFTTEQETAMKNLLKQDRYIPQEILNYGDF